MAKLDYSTTIAIDTERSVFHFYSMMGNDKSKIVHNIRSYNGAPFSEEFFDKFKHALKKFVKNNPSESIRKVTVVLPDNAVLHDTIRIPTMKGMGQTKKALDVTLGGLYKNYEDLRVVLNIAQQNKQNSTFVLAAVQKKIITSIYGACAENKLLADNLTCAAGATICGAVLMNSKLKNQSYLFLDIKDVYSRFVFVIDGNAVGYYTLPFGLEFLRRSKVVQEDMLFDHSYAELTVLNAREKAKSKALTVMNLADSSAEADDEDEDDEDELLEENEIVSDEDPTPADTVRAQANNKIFLRKAPRKLPKFMLREIPESKEGILYENFRVFVKWALTLIGENDKLTELGKPEFVCVNMPNEMAGVLDKVNEESEENGITFIHLSNAAEDEEILENLELYGALYPNQITSMSKF